MATLHSRNLPAVCILLSVLYLSSTALPLRDMTENLAQDHANVTASNASSPDLIQSHQDLHPVRVPDDAANLAESNHTTTDLPSISSFPELQKELQPTPALNVTHMKDATVVVPAVPNVQRPNATQFDKLLTNLDIPIVNPDSPVIQHKFDAAADAPKPLSRDLLPSIVANGNKELSPNPAGSPAVPPAAVEQAKGNLPKELIANPFGQSPAMIPVGAPPLEPVAPVKPNPF